MPMKFCSQCGGSVAHLIPEGDDRPRYVCGVCGAIHYENPKIVVGCIPERKNKVLLCRRAIAPRYGLWTIPAGYLENGETLIEATKREAFEEARARVEILGLYTLFDLTRFHQVYAIFRSRLLDDDYAAGEESLEVRLFEEAEIPWDNLAFQVVEQSLRQYFLDRPEGEYPLHIRSIPPR